MLLASEALVDDGIVRCGSNSYPVAQITNVEVSSTRAPNNLAQGLLVAAGVFGYLSYVRAWGGSLAALATNLRYDQDAVIVLALAVICVAAAVWNFVKAERRKDFWITLSLTDRTSVRLSARSMGEAEKLRGNIEQSITSAATPLKSPRST